MLINDPYLRHQLIPYIGNKRKLLPMIQSAVEATGLKNGVFCDLFAGSGVVSRFAKRMGFRVISNDWEPYTEKINLAYIEANQPPAFTAFGGIGPVFQKLNALSLVRGYIATHYCPMDDENPDFRRERMFYTQENGQKIDAIREEISSWRKSGLIDRMEEAVLLAPLIYQASYCSNTSGVFKGFHHGWGGRTSTALYRIRSKLAISPPVFYDNGQANAAMRENALEVAEKIDCDIAYIDPPYNQHQYGSNYHLLNTVTLWDKPPVSRYILPGSKSAIRLDWRTLRRSPYCYKSTALPAFSELVARIRARYVLVSYSTDGIIPTDELLQLLGARGSLMLLTRQYKRYRVSSQRPSPKPHTIEFVAIIDTAARSKPKDIDRAVESIREAGIGRQDS
ncbi:MAG: DNA adenine methylase [Armatimonadota bacterium]